MEPQLPSTPRLEALLPPLREAVPEGEGRRAVDLAIRWMQVAHRDQRRPDLERTPYAEHPAEVATLVVRHGGPAAAGDPALVVAALLHDTVEDQPEELLRLAGREASEPGRLAADAIRALAGAFGEDVARLVGLLTSPGVDERTPALFGHPPEGVKALIKAEIYRAHLTTLIRYEPRAALIKLADVSTNALALGSVPPGPKREKLLRKYRPALVAVEEELGRLPSGHLLASWAGGLRSSIQDALAGPYALPG